MAVISEYLRMSGAMLLGRRCGENSTGFYDRKGDYFRKGVDPRNHVGRHILRKTQDWGHTIGCHWLFSPELAGQERVCTCGVGT